MTAEIKRSVCPYDCPDACGLLVQVSGGRAIKVLGDAQHHFTRGTLCPKMVHYEKTVHSPLRITTPLLRTGHKGCGRFQPISWEEAIGHIARRWQEIIAACGAEAILPFSYAGTMGIIQRNAGHPFFHALGASRLDRTICSPAKDYGWKAVMGHTLSLPPNEVIHSDLIILWGTNTVATNIHFLHDVRKAKERGATVWLIDTYETPTAKAADKIFLIRPGSDGALALGLMHVLARDHLINEAFIHKYVQGYEELQARILPDYSPQAVSEITGLPAAVIETLAHAYASAQAPFIRLGSGLSRYGNGAMTVRTITCLPALVGAWEKPGGGLLAGVSTGSALNTAAVIREDFMAKPARIINMNQLGNALTQLSDPPIRSLYVYHSNPAAVAPDQNAVLKGLSRDDLFTVVHERFMTDTASFADIILPATTSLEHSDLYRSYGHYGIQRAYPAIPAVGEAKSNWEVFRLLAKALGLNDPFFQQTADELIDAMLATPASWPESIDLAELQAGYPIVLPLPKDYKTTFKTPSGKIQILNPAEIDALPKYILPHGDAEPYWLMTAPSLVMLNSSFNERTDLVGKKANTCMTLLMNPTDATAKQLTDGQQVAAFNCRGEATFMLQITPRVPAGVVVAEGVWWLSHAPGNRTVNALTSQRLTDKAGGSTFYDTKVDVKAI